MKKPLYIILLFINVLASSATLFTAYAGMIDPSRHARLSALSIIFPYVVLSMVAFLLLWLVLHRRYMLLSVMTLLLVLPAIRTTLPINIRSTPPEGALKVMTFNTWLFAKWEYPASTDNAIIRYICDSDADIVCLQEASFNERDSVMLMQPLAERYPYRELSRINNSETQVMLLSKFPIISAEQISYESQGNQSVAYDVLVNGDTLLVINNHFETNSISMDDRSHMRSLAHDDEMEMSSKGHYARMLFEKLAFAANKRAPQARAVAQYIKERAKRYVIVCGDFNDHPLSYTCRTVGKGLTDCFVNTGNGRGYTYQQGDINVRIDHMMCSKALQPFACKVDESMTDSDHYPLICYFTQR